jgi:hypothetical protein
MQTQAPTPDYHSYQPSLLQHLLNAIFNAEHCLRLVRVAGVLERHFINRLLDSLAPVIGVNVTQEFSTVVVVFDYATLYRFDNVVT